MRKPLETVGRSCSREELTAVLSRMVAARAKRGYHLGPQQALNDERSGGDPVRRGADGTPQRKGSPPEVVEALIARGGFHKKTLVLSGLDPDKPYGIAYYGRTRSAYESMRSKRRKVEQAPRSRWTAIPVCLEGAGLDRGQIERARAFIADNRAPSKVADHEHHLSRASCSAPTAAGRW